MPAHSSHILQPLNIGCFSALKQAYGCGVEQLIGCGVNHINKHEFLPLYRRVRRTALYKNNIRAGFAATGLVLYSPDYVLVQLHAKFQTLLPQRRSLSNASWAAETPHNIAKLQKQQALIQRYIQRRIRSPLSLIE